MIQKTSNSVEGIVLRTFPYAENDLIIRILTASEGKVSILARGAKKSKKRYSSCPDIFDKGTFSYRFGKGSLPNLQDFDAKGSFKAVRDNLFKMSLASLVCECFDGLIKEHSENDEATFLLLQSCLNTIDTAQSERDALKEAFHSFGLLLELSGFEAFDRSITPGLRALSQQLTKIEHIIEHELRSKQSLIELAKQTLMK